jgi:dihydrodipicolinate synthase/N-acetylneuraminate lyase
VTIPPLRTGRSILGVSAVLLPFDHAGAVDWAAFATLVARTVRAGLLPAVNMDTGYVQVIDEATRARVLEVARGEAGDGGFVAGAFVADVPGAPLDVDAYLRAMDAIRCAGGTPVVFPSHGLNALGDDEWVAAHDAFGARIDRFIGFELGSMFVPYGRIYSIAAYEGLVGVAACIGAKHSSLSRPLEWERLALRDRLRPDFHVFTGNDLAIDMVCYGSDYLLGLSAFAPDAFAERDRRWATNDASFYELNDVLQYLGCFAFRPPVPAYRHDAAMFLALRGALATDAPPRGAPTRPDSDRAVLADIAARLDALL